MKHRLKVIFRWVDERVQLDELIEFMKHKTVPVNRHSVWYYFGGVTLFLFIIQVFTGILLLMYYKGSEELAFESIHFIMSRVQFGWLIRSIHSWTANLFILAAMIHMFSVFFTKAYRKPREITWLTGMLMFFLALGFGFSGYLLPWNELAFFATKVGTQIAGAIPVIGKPMMIFLRGGENVTGATLSRFFGFHVAVFPGIFTIFLGIHLLLVQRQGMSEPIGGSTTPSTSSGPRLANRGSTTPSTSSGPRLANRSTMPFFPNFMLRDLLLWLIVLNILAILAVFFPWDLGHKADAFAAAPAGIKPEWYFLFMFQTLKYIPGSIFTIDGEILGILFFSAAGILWMFIPFWDAKSARGERNRTLSYIGIAIVGYIVVLTIIGWIL